MPYDRPLFLTIMVTILMMALTFTSGTWISGEQCNLMSLQTSACPISQPLMLQALVVLPSEVSLWDS